MGVALIMSLFLALSMDDGTTGSRQEAQRRVGVVAHRGAGAGATRPERPPENTLDACRWGWASGATWVECDVVLTGDDVPVVTHDFSTDRFTEPAVVVSESTVEALRTLDAGSWKDSRWRDLRIPTLGEVLAAVPVDRGLVIEIKSGPESAKPVIEAIEASGVEFDRLMIISFNIDTLRAVRQGCPAVPVLWLMSFKPGEDEEGSQTWNVSWRTGTGRGRSVEQALDLEAVIAEAIRERFDGLDTTAEHPANLAARLHGAGLCLGVWTVNDPEVALQLARSGVDEITTDDPPTILKALRDAGFEVGRWSRRRQGTKPAAD